MTQAYVDVSLDETKTPEFSIHRLSKDELTGLIDAANQSPKTKELAERIMGSLLQGTADLICKKTKDA